jgi:Xaa-Pro dipeptidase
MRKHIIEKLQSAMKERGWDAIVCCSPENYGYVTGFIVPSQPLMRWRHAMAVIRADGTRALLSVDMEASTVRKNAPGEVIQVWKEFSYDAMDQLAVLLDKLELSRGKIGIEMDYLPAGDFLALAKRRSGIEWQPAEAVLARLRQNKTQEEVALLRRLSMIADKAIAKAFESVEAGNTELDLAGALTRAVYDEGAEYFKLMIVATGERSVLPNVGPTDRVLKDGDICRVEIFPIIGGYHAGVCRTAQVGKAPRHAEDIWRKLVECKYMLLERIRPGALCSDIYRDYCHKLQSLGLPLISFVGHGIGLHLHEDPYLGAFCSQPLEAGMVLGIEPLIYETGHGYGMQNKDMVVVTETGCELLSAHTNTDQLIRVRA